MTPAQRLAIVADVSEDARRISATGERRRREQSQTRRRLVPGRAAGDAGDPSAQHLDDLPI